MSWRWRSKVLAMSFKADLHCHSLCSDGTLEPQELIQKAKEVGLQGLSITDHDTLKAYENLIIPEGFIVGIGVEFSCEYHRSSVHVLGYDVNPKHEAIQALCEQHVHRRKRRNQGILKKLALMGMVITEEELESRFKQDNIGRPHIATLLIKKGYISTLQEAFNRWLGEGKPAFVQEGGISIEVTLKAIHQAGGKAFLAHPHLIENKKKLENLLQFSFDGIEAYYGRFPPEIQKVWEELAKKRGLLISGGSDFHGDIKPNSYLGSSFVGREDFDKIFASPLRG